MRFVDEVNLHLIAGHGGRGASTFRREAHVPLGGPDGGAGGRGGDIYFQADSAIPTLLDLKGQRTFRAGNGAPGGGNRCSGKAGSDLTLRVPVGTQVVNEETGQLIADLTTDRVVLKIAGGGKGGK